MKIPKKITTLLNRRVRYAYLLAKAETELDEWLEKQGIDLGDPEISDALVSGCLIYCEPDTARIVVTRYLEGYKNEKQ